MSKFLFAPYNEDINLMKKESLKRRDRVGITQMADMLPSDISKDSNPIFGASEGEQSQPSFPPSGHQGDEIMKDLGKHLLLAYKTKFNLEDTDSIKNILREAIIKSGAKIQGIIEKKFSPHGYSIVILISESHASIHTYPEHQSLFVDYFTCGENVDIEIFRKYFLDHIPAEEIYEDVIISRPFETFKRKKSRKVKDGDKD